MILSRPLTRGFFCAFRCEKRTTTRRQNASRFYFVFYAHYDLGVLNSHFISVTRAIFRCIKTTFFDRNIACSTPKIVKILTNLWSFPYLIGVHKWDITGSTDTQLDPG